MKINGLIEDEIKEINDIIDGLCEQNAAMNQALVLHDKFLHELESAAANTINTVSEHWLIAKIKRFYEELDKL